MVDQEAGIGKREKGSSCLSTVPLTVLLHRGTLECSPLAVSFLQEVISADKTEDNNTDFKLLQAIDTKILILFIILKSQYQ